ncbi:MAG: hypothetical protein HC847_16350 [Hydrococcus sp. RU_2_2]|nr:hypothetical protein [Hydrococcus sp. RU_2_2]
MIRKRALPEKFLTQKLNINIQPTLKKSHPKERQRVCLSFRYRFDGGQLLGVDPLAIE